MAYTSETRSLARQMRIQGATHREIAKQLNVAISTAYAWTRSVVLTSVQKQAIKKRRKVYQMSEPEKEAAKSRLQRYWATHKFTNEQLLARITHFYEVYGRIPLKREFNAWDTYAARFGSWNAAIRTAGFVPNTALYSKRFTAKDGHVCDSYSELIIDNWLSSKGVAHERHVPYPGTRLTADFQLGDGTYVEFFGLAGAQSAYDRTVARKREFAGKHSISLIELHPQDLYPAPKLDHLLVGDTGFEPVTSRV